MSDSRSPKVISVEDLAEAVTAGALRALKAEIPLLEHARAGNVVSFRPGIWIGIPAEIMKANLSTQAGAIADVTKGVG